MTESMDMDAKWKLFKHRALVGTTAASALFLSACILPGGEDPDPENPEVTLPEENNTPANNTTPENNNTPANNGTANNNAQPTPPSGQTTFYSADGRNGQRTQENDDRNEAEPGAAADEDGFDNAGGGDDRTVEEGDIYRVIQGDKNLILNLNSYRGLQIIDFTDVASPKILGRVQVSGSPVEMYQVGDRVFVLLNNWYSYWRSSRYSVTPERHHGGGIVVVDISDKANPKITAQGHIDGWIRTSRLTRGGGKEALYVVANEYNGGGQTNVKSFSVSSQGKLLAKTDLALGGYVQDIQATPQRLIVSRYNYNQHQGRSEVSLIDISSPEGDMVEGDSVIADGYVRNKTNLDLHDGVLRVVSSNNWSSNTNTNHVQTFDATNINNLTQIDHKTFGDNEDLYATLFMENKAFFVTYRRVDPFHAFEVTSDGFLTEKSEFIVSGWNDYFRPVAAKTRLIGIGKNDENGTNTMAVSLYDASDLTNTNPLIARAEVELDHSWSEAQWDDRAFSVLEKATSIPSPDGSAIETGMVLLPFSGWNDTEKRYISAVQIYTFSANTLTLRGVMDHGSPVRRSFMADSAANTTANLSEAELSLFDTTNPAQPSEEGRLELAPNFSNFKVFGSYGVRYKNRSDYYGWWRGSSGQNMQTDSIDIVALGGNVDREEPVATIDVPANSSTYQVGDHLVTISSTWQNNNNQALTDVEVWDLSNPAQPVLDSTMQTDRIRAYGGYYYGWEDCWDCGGYYGYSYSTPATTVGDKLVFTRNERQEKLEGTIHRRYIRPRSENYRYNRGCYNYDSGMYEEQACTYHAGNIRCDQLHRVDGTIEGEVCQGSLLTCSQDANGETDCQEVELGDIPTEEREYEYEKRRYWNSYVLDVLDLSNPKQPVITQEIAMPTDEEAAGLVADGDSLFVNFKKPYDLEGDSRPYVRYYLKEVDLTNASAPTVSDAVNIPGQLMFVEGDTLLTKDFLWGETIVENSLNRLELFDGKAYLQGAPQRFVDQQVEQITLDGAGHALVSHYKAYYANYDENHYDWEDYDYTRNLTMIDVDSQGFDKLSQTEVDDWATLVEARAGRALYQVPGGLLVINMDNPSQPYAQAYYPTRGWPSDLTVEGDTIYFSAGRYGIYQFGLDDENLYLTQE